MARLDFIPQNECFSFLLRFFIVLQFLIGILFITFACILQSPPKNAVPIGLIILGVFTILTSFFGCFGACYKRSCLTCYILWGVAVTVAQAILVFYMFGNGSKVAHDIASYQNSAAVNIGSEQSVQNNVNTARWVLFVFVIIELVGLLLALCMRICVSKDAPNYSNFEDEERQATQMQNLRAGSESTKAYGAQAARLDRQMAEKYGGSSDIDFMAGHRWYNMFTK